MRTSKVLDIDVKDLPYQEFMSSRYSMTVKVDVSETYKFAKKENLSFFNLTAGSILEGLNQVPELKRRIVDNKVIEFDKLNGVTPILQEDFSIREIEFEPISDFKDIFTWNDYLNDKKANIVDYGVDPFERDSKPIANLSCVKWIDFEAMDHIILEPKQCMPVIAWGKMVDGKVPLSLSSNHMFVFGYHYHLFYENVEKYLANPNLAFEK